MHGLIPIGMEVSISNLNDLGDSFLDRAGQRDIESRMNQFQLAVSSAGVSKCMEGTIRELGSTITLADVTKDLCCGSRANLKRGLGI